jgi:hypothetical protein
MADRCPLPATGPSCLGLAAFGRTMPASCVFRPRGFSPPRRLPPPAARGLVASHCRPWGSSGFRRGHALLRATGASPPMPCPPEPSPPVQPYPRHREPLPSCRCRLRSRCHRVLLDFKALLRTSSALRWSAVAGRPRPVALLGFPSWSITSVVPSSPPQAGAGGGCAQGPSRGTMRDVHAFPTRGPSDVRCAGEGRPREAVGTVKGAVHEGRDHPAPTRPANRRASPGQGPEANPGDHRRAGRPTAAADDHPPPRLPGGAAPVARDALLRGATSRRRRPAVRQARRIPHVPDVVSGPSLVAARPCPAPRCRTGRDPCGTHRRARRKRTRQGGGSEGPPRRSPDPRGEAAPARQAARQRRHRRPSCGLRARWTCPFRTRLRPGRWKDRVSPEPPCPCQDSAGHRVAAAPPALLVHPPGCPPRGTTAVVCATSARPLRGEAPAPPSRGHRRAPRPGCVLTDLTCTGGLSDAVGRHGAPW